jgi:hypothetical protein
MSNSRDFPGAKAALEAEAVQDINLAERRP